MNSQKSRYWRGISNEILIWKWLLLGIKGLASKGGTFPKGFGGWNLDPFKGG